MGCKRVVFSNDWYPALARPSLELVMDRIHGSSRPGSLLVARPVPRA